jgi:hypothetical protein
MPETPIEVREVWAWCLCVVGYAMWQVWATEQRWREQDLAADLADMQRMTAESQRLGDWQRAHGQRP